MVMIMICNGKNNCKIGKNFHISEDWLKLLSFCTNLPFVNMKITTKDICKIIGLFLTTIINTSVLIKQACTGINTELH